MIKFAVISPHAPILLPDIGTVSDHQQIENTIRSLNQLGEDFAKLNIDEIIISSPHRDWGFNVPLFFIAKNFSGKIHQFLCGEDSVNSYFLKGEKFAKKLDQKKSFAIIASGDLSHVLTPDGPYGFHPDGPKFDREFSDLLMRKNVEEILRLDKKYPFAADCGMRSFAFTFGLLFGENSKLKSKILSYEAPFGVGYLVAKLI